MKKIILTASIIFFAIASTFAQRYAYVDSEYILGNIPEYKDAQQQLEDLSSKWQRDIEKKYQEIDALYREFQADAALMPEEMKKQREDEIIQREKAVKQLQRQYFGKNGELFKKRQELIKPIQEKIFNAIEEIANSKNYAFVFDKAENPKILFADSKYDISDKVLKTMGYSF